MDINEIIDMPFHQLPRGDKSRIAIAIDSDSQWTWEDLRQRRNQFASILQKAGVSSGDRVGMVMVNSLDYVALYFAIARLGAIAVRLNFRLTASELQFLITDSGSTVVFFDESRKGQMEVLHNQTEVKKWFCLGKDHGAIPAWASAPDFDEAETGDPGLPRPKADQPLMIMYTSGTTGRPKGSIWTHENSLWFASIQTQQWAFDANSVTLTTGPLYHAGALECFTLPALLAGGTAVIMSSGGMSAQKIAETIDTRKVSQALLYPFLIHGLMALNEPELDKLSSLNLIMSGGDPLSPKVVEQVKRKLAAVELNKGYGLTEGGAQSAVLTQADSDAHPGAVGRPLPFTQIKVANADGVELPHEQVGEVWVKSPAISGKYWNRPEATRETFVDGWCRTGDLGQVTSDGFLVLAGREKDMIRSGGENIYPAEIEKALSGHPAVGQVAVVGVDDAKYVEVGCAVVVLAPGFNDEAAVESELRQLVASSLAKYKQPKIYRFVEDLPVSPSGKILKRNIRAAFASIQLTDAVASDNQPVTTSKEK